MSFNYTWFFEGTTQQSEATTARSISGFPVDPFPEADIIQVAKTVILSETTAKFQQEMLAGGFTAVVTKIEPEAWITTTYVSRQYRDYTEVTWQHWLHMKATVSFTTDKSIMESPLAPAVLAAIVKVVEYLIVVLAAAALIYGVALAFINSFLVTTTEIIYYDENGNIIKKEKTTTPSLTGQIGVIIIAIAAILIFALMFGRKK